METGAITQYVDVAQIVLYMFWIFFAGLIYYLLRENHREGYPMDSGRPNGPVTGGWPPVPASKTYKLENGRTVLSPDPNRRDGVYSFESANPWSGSPIEPKGDPLLAGVGPGAWANRVDEPDVDAEGHPSFAPLRVATEYSVSPKDVDPRGLPVIGADGESAGTVCDLWIDRSEVIFRFIEFSLNGSGDHVMIPINFARITSTGVKINALMSTQFANVPRIRSTDQITLLEEERIAAYYGAGTLYAHPNRQEPLL
jgi:photosynthetic reaction center H subunit